jgi:cytochrome c peroxidase
MRIPPFRFSVGLLVLCGLVAATIALRQRDVSSFHAAVNTYRGDLSRLDSALRRLNSALDTDQPAVQQAFRDARSAFKRVEMFVEYYSGLEARNLNAPPLFRPEDEDPETPLVPTGLQVIEADVFPTFDRGRIPAAKRQVELMRSAITRLSAAGTDSMPGDAFLFDAMRHELARVATLGIVGFDVTSSGDAMTESADALEGIAHSLEPYRRTIARRNRAALDSLDPFRGGNEVSPRPS